MGSMTASFAAATKKAATTAMMIGMSMFLGTASGQENDDVTALRPLYFKQWRDPVKIVVFGDSMSDYNNRYFAPASIDVDDIGPYPWFRLFEAPDSNRKKKAYAPVKGAATNGKVWPTWYRIVYGRNRATVGASASDAFRSREDCTGYTGEGEEHPTGTLAEQITDYLRILAIGDGIPNAGSTYDFTHIIMIGAIEPTRVLEAHERYTIGGDGYVDPVAFENVFEDVNGVPALTFAPMIREVTAAWQEGIDRLREVGITGRILLANIPSPRGIPSAEASGLADILEPVSVALNIAAQAVAAANSDVRMLDLYSLSAAVVDQPEIFTTLGFTAGGAALGEPCLTMDFVVDTQAEIMGTQADRAPGCQEQCGLCADNTTPCQTCFAGNPSGTICAEPERYVYWDDVHFTQDFHLFLAEAIRHCSHDSPNYDRDWVEVLCPGFP